jgi:hypothetical protein
MIRSLYTFLLCGAFYSFNGYGQEPKLLGKWQSIDDTNYILVIESYELCFTYYEYTMGKADTIFFKMTTKENDSIMIDDSLHIFPCDLKLTSFNSKIVNGDSSRLTTNCFAISFISDNYLELSEYKLGRIQNFRKIKTH